MHAVPIPLTRLHLGQKAVPDEAVDVGKRDPVLCAVLVEQTQFHALGGLTE
jgi:hypothetical protein